MNKIFLRLSLVALIACVVTMGTLSFTSQLAYSTHVQSKKTLNGGFAEAVVKTGGKTYSLDGRYDVEINDDNTLAIKQNSEANNNKKIKLNENDDLTIDFKCKDNDCKQTARHGEYKFISVYLVDKN